MSAFNVRDYRPETDEAVCLSLWLKHYAFNTKPGQRVDMANNRRYWAQHARIVSRLLMTEWTRVAVDVEDEDIVYAFSCVGRGESLVHFFAMKGGLPSWKDDFIEALIGEERLCSRQYVTYLIPALQPMPHPWILDPYCLPGLLDGL